jgi:hypothetical protein
MLLNSRAKLRCAFVWCFLRAQTIATTCPALNVTSLDMSRNSSKHDGEQQQQQHDNCGHRGDGGASSSSSDNNDDDASISPSCDAFKAVMDLQAGFAGACPANFGVDGSVTVLASGAALVPPPNVTDAADVSSLPKLSPSCARLLGVALPPPRAATAAPVALVKAGVKLGGYTAATFTPDVRAGFITATAAMLNVNPADIVITNVTDAPAAAPATRRAMLVAPGGGVTVEFTVAAPTNESVADVSNAINDMTTTNAVAFTAQLQTAGVADVTTIEATAAPREVAAPPPAAPVDTASGAARGMTASAALAALLVVAVSAAS